MKTNGATRVPSLTDFPEYAELVAKRAEITSQREVVQHELTNLHRALTTSNIPDSVTKRGRRIAEILGDPEPENSPDRSKYPVLNQQLADLSLALEEIDRRMATVRGRISRDISEKIKPEHDRLVHNICKALINAHHANAAYRALVDELNGQDICWTGVLRPMHPGLLGDPRDAHSRIATYLREAVEYEMFDVADIPDELAWPPKNVCPARLRSQANGAKKTPGVVGRASDMIANLLPG